MKAILTGHTRGLGAAIARELLSRGMSVLGLARKKNEELARDFPDLLEQVEIDLADTAALLYWLASGRLQQYCERCSSVLLINNAGIVQPVGSLDMQNAALVARAISLNVAAPLTLSAAMAQASCDASDRRILHVSSGAGRSAYPAWSIYCAGKAALDHHARSIALDKTAGLRICSLAPGVIDTDMQAEIRATSLEQFPLRPRFDELKRSGQLVSPAHCAKQIVDYLLSERFGSDPVADLRD